MIILRLSQRLPSPIVLRNILSLMLSMSLVSPHSVLAENPTPSPSQLQEYKNLLNKPELNSKIPPTSFQIPVHVWGLGNSKIELIPLHTDLLTFLTTIGVSMETSELTDIKIKRRTKSEEEILKIDGERLLTKPNVLSPTLEANDIIIIPPKTPPIHQNVIAVLSYTTTLAGLILAIVGFSAILNK
jgi:hypothetical protein